MGVRADKKQKIYTSIVDASKKIFSKQDFDETTMEQIAAEAGVGLGTAYNYFKSKEELYILSMADKIASTTFDVSSTSFQEEDVATIVANAIIHEIRKINYIPRKIWKTALPFMMNGLKGDSDFIKNVFKADYQFMEKIKLLLEALKECKKLPSDYPTELAVDLIFGHILYIFMSYIYFDDMSFELVCEKIRSGIHLLTK